MADSKEKSHQRSVSEREGESVQGGASALLLSLAALFISVTSFRLTVLTQANRLTHPALSLTISNHQLEQQLTTVKDMMLTFLQHSNTDHQQVGQPDQERSNHLKILHQHPVFRRAKNPQLNLAALESVVAELFGLPCPATGRVGSPNEKSRSDGGGLGDLAVPLVDNGLCISQLRAVEPVLLLCAFETVSSTPLQARSNIHTNKQTLLDGNAVDAVLSMLLSGNSASPPSPSPHSSMLLLQMRGIIERDLWKEEDDGNKKEMHGSPMSFEKSGDTQRMPSTHAINPTDTVRRESFHNNDMLAAAELYLITLNTSMAERNKVLRRLVTLWQKTKRIFEQEADKVGERRTTTLPQPPVAILRPEVLKPDDSSKIGVQAVLREVEALQRSLLDTDIQHQQQERRFATVINNYSSYISTMNYIYNIAWLPVVYPSYGTEAVR